MLRSSASPLSDDYDLAMLDLDGVVYVGTEAVPGAAGHLASVRGTGMRVAFITNNASRTPEAVAEHLNALGIQAVTDDVVTSAQAAARVLVDRLGPGARVVLLGGEGLQVALREAGLYPVGVEEDAEAVVTGYGPQVVWADIMRVAVRIGEGLWWVASNTDGSIPTPFGRAPGHGVLVETLQRFTGADPVVAGKPARPLLDETIRRVGGERPLMVGDRLDTDIEGGRAAGVPTLLVLTGVTGLPELVTARPEQRPTYLGLDLGALGRAHPTLEPGSAGFRVGGWSAEVEGGRLRLTGDGGAENWWRAAAATSWAWLDAAGEAVDIEGLAPPRVPGATTAER